MSDDGEAHGTQEWAYRFKPAVKSITATLTVQELVEKLITAVL